LKANLPGVDAHDVGVSIPELRDLQNSGAFQNVSLCFFGSVNPTGSAQPARIAAKSVSPSYFAVLGVDPDLGRTFDPHDATPGFNLEVVISDGLWKRAFGADSHILGKSLRLDNVVFHVVGVTPASFRDQGIEVHLRGLRRETRLKARDGLVGETRAAHRRRGGVAEKSGRRLIIRQLQDRGFKSRPATNSEVAIGLSAAG
jgi:hypothetical protein